MASPEGYQVGHKGMPGQAGELDGAGRDVGKIGKAIAGTMCYSQDALGGADTAPAFNTFAAAWEAETKVLEAALHELADKVRLSSRAYSGSDIGVRSGAKSVSVGSAAEGRVSTMPTYAERPSALSGY
ncbi:hypothetical protein [Streptomyces sp. NPDC058695]|uniref:hypothetical protein n=1 Tax=Streptomyces sp. NPDC058695 TaxID=3346604 RepID=UPI003666ED29